MENVIHHDWCRIPGDDIGHDRGNRESLLAGCPDGDCGGQLGVPLQWRIPGVVTAGGSSAMGSTADKTTADYGGEVSAARGSYLIW